MPQANSYFGRVLTGLDNFIGKVESLILTLSIVAMATNSIANVFGRYLFNQSLYFSDELNQFLIVIITFMGLGYITRQGKHIRMSAFYDILPAAKRKLLMVLIAFVTAIVMLILAWSALEYVLKIAQRGWVTPALQVPLYLTYMWVALGLLLASIQYFLTAIKNLDHKDPKVFISFSVVDEYEDADIKDMIENAQLTPTETADNINLNQVSPQEPRR